MATFIGMAVFFLGCCVFKENNIALKKNKLDVVLTHDICVQ